MSTLKLQITEDMKNAMRQGDKQRLNIIRMILAAIKQREVDERIAVDDTQVLAIMDKMIKERKDAMGQFQAANRQDLVDKEKYDIDVLQAYLPTPLTEAEVAALIKKTMAEIGASSMKDMGKVMAALKPHIQGRTDTAVVSAKVKELLN